ncbi:MAG: Asp-tRNA(Asn)/Glu-tRNA(Gln) amidotransferase subunit GatC [Firmicutes bacterium]|nr:Asp-tRNA(Asn)/Glu-tRNA(Gln) amidotransferase subunit GatC [Bacillota bacterium]
MAADPGIEKELDELCILASLYLSPAEKEQIARRLNAVIKMLSKIGEVNTAGVEPAVHPAALKVRFREDEVQPSLPREFVFKNTIHRSEDHFCVPRIAGDKPD